MIYYNCFFQMSCISIRQSQTFLEGPVSTVLISWTVLHSEQLQGEGWWGFLARGTLGSGSLDSKTKSSDNCVDFSRLLIDIATGVDTCADRVELHDDGEEILETEKNKLVDVFRGLFDNTDSSHVDDAQ